MAQELSGKIAIVTGGASGLGRATVECFVREGAKVVIADVDSARGEELAANLGANAVFKRTNVAEAKDVEALVGFAAAKFGGLHVMFNNAGISPSNNSRLANDDLQDFHQVMAVNLLGVMLGTKYAAHHMARNGGGSIINTGSIGGTMPGYGVMSYRVSKAAVNHFTKCAAIEYGEQGIRVNCINPGSIQTEMITFREPGMTQEQVDRVSKALTPLMTKGQLLKRRGKPEDVANAALYLASDRSAQVTGIALTVDGGHSAGDSFNYMEEILEARAKALTS